MLTLPKLKPGDCVEIIAPASRCSDKVLFSIKELLESWQLTCLVDSNIFGDDLLCANSDHARFESLKNALSNTGTKAIICARGGYGSMRLIPQLSQMIPPTNKKLFVGMSDITALSLYLQQQWQWPTIHGSLAPDKFSQTSLATLKALLFSDNDQFIFEGIPLNHLANTNTTITSAITGGNLCLVQTSIGTIWQMDGRNKFVFLEEIGERGYRIDRMLEHLLQANVFTETRAIIFGDFIKGLEPDGSCLINPVLERFAERCDIPVIQIPGIGHDHNNKPLLLGTKATLELGSTVNLVCHR